MAPPVYVRYCVSGHEVRFSGLCPFSCPICGGPIDRSKQPILLEELEAQKELLRKNKQEQVSNSSETDVNSLSPEEPSVEEMKIEKESPLSGRRPEVVRQPVRSRIPLSTNAEQQGQRTAEQTPLQRRRAPKTDRKLSGNFAGLQLNYFGDAIEIPEEGGWLGRDGIGASYFEGNRYISRKHVFVKPDLNGRLIVQEDCSLNGVYYDTGSGKQKLAKDSTIILQEGNILWMYNIPLKLERKNHD